MSAHEQPTSAAPAPRVTVVTGGCGILGSVLVRELAAIDNHTVAVVDRPGMGAGAFAASLPTAQHSHAIGFDIDLADIGSLPERCNELIASAGVPTGLVNAAASKGKDVAAFLEPVESYTNDTWRSVMDVNIDGLFFLTKNIGEHMARAGQGSIVNVSSIYGHLGPDQRIYRGSEYEGLPLSSPAAYSASKAAVIGLTRHLATWWASSGVRVNAISPGGIFSGQNEQFVSSYSERVPLGRMANASEVTAVIRFLLSQDSSYMTGQNLCVDGGLSAW